MYDGSGQTRTKNVSLDLLRPNQSFGMGFGNVTLEVSISDHLREIRASFGMTKKILREEQDQL
jgi:hypothetical protein